jgi:hypothetical protein
MTALPTYTYTYMQSMLSALTVPAAAHGYGMNTTSNYHFTGSACLPSLESAAHMTSPMTTSIKREPRKKRRMSVSKPTGIFDFFYHAGAVSSV